jgi:prolyl 4-hydroxylase
MGSMLLPHEPFSIPQLVRYRPGQKYDLHTDFWPQHQVMNDGSGRQFNRAASFFVFLRANCTGGETWFPKVDVAYSSAERPASGDDMMEKWYGERVVREERDGESSGVKFKPIVGSAIFWVNLNEEGEGDGRVVHAGLPVEEGEKIGLNIWPRRFFGTENGGEEEVEKKGGSWSGKWKE